MNNAYEFIFNLLSDDQSKFIFENRLKYNETRDSIFLDNIICRYCPPIDNVRIKFINTIKTISFNKNIIICGAHNRAKRICRWLNEYHIPIFAIYDNDKNKQGTFFCDKLVMSPVDIDFSNSCVIITQIKDENIKVLSSQAKNSSDSCDVVIYKDYLASDMFEDQYFDKIISFNHGEIFVDAGVLDLSTSISFVNKCISGGINDFQIFAFEPDCQSYNNCIRIVKSHNLQGRLRLYNLGLYDKKSSLSFLSDGGASRVVEDNADYSINVVALDDTIDKATYIKMDIEGSELKALKGASRIISSYKPKLAISAYHRKEDLLDLPLYIYSLNSSYSFYLRHYSRGPAETVLYAI